MLNKLGSVLHTLSETIRSANQNLNEFIYDVNKRYNESIDLAILKIIQHYDNKPLELQKLKITYDPNNFITYVEYEDVYVEIKQETVMNTVRYTVGELKKN